MSLTTRERGAYTQGGWGWLIFEWKNALLIWGAYIRGELIHGGLIYGILRYTPVTKKNGQYIFLVPRTLWFPKMHNIYF